MLCVNAVGEDERRRRSQVIAFSFIQLLQREREKGKNFLRIKVLWIVSEYNSVTYSAFVDLGLN